MPLPKITITVVQHDDPQKKSGYKYRVVSLQNDIEPPVGTFLTPDQVTALIRRNVTVNVKGAK
jgi:hypothetical protein